MPLGPRGRTGCQLHVSMPVERLAYGPLSRSGSPPLWLYASVALDLFAARPQWLWAGLAVGPNVAQSLYPLGSAEMELSSPVVVRCWAAGPLCRCSGRPLVRLVSPPPYLHTHPVVHRSTCVTLRLFVRMPSCGQVPRTLWGWGSPPVRRHASRKLCLRAPRQTRWRTTLPIRG